MEANTESLFPDDVRSARSTTFKKNDPTNIISGQKLATFAVFVQCYEPAKEAAWVSWKRIKIALHEGFLV